MAHNILFLTLKVFSATGGIEKVCRVAGKALFEHTLGHNVCVRIFSMYDKQPDADDNKYFPSEMFTGFGTKKMRFIYDAIKEGVNCDVVVLSHINLLLAGWLIKKISPSTKIILYAHGIEVWEKFNPRKKMMMNSCDLFLPVSKFTSEKLQTVNKIPAHKCRVLNNCLDPFLPLNAINTKDLSLRHSYGIDDDQQLLFTLTRLSSKERYKGYDKVLHALVSLKQRYPKIHYLLGGSYDQVEKKYLDEMIDKLGLRRQVTIAGYIPDEHLVAHFSTADIYVMPSIKEGFGIVFIEAMYYGLPVIAGNQDGSVDALCNGRLGILIDPLDVVAIEGAIEKIILHETAYIPDRELLMKHFSYESYKAQFEEIMNFVGTDGRTFSSSVYSGNLSTQVNSIAN